MNSSALEARESGVISSSGREWLGIEVKANRNPGYNDAKGLRTFLHEYSDIALGGLLLHGGEETMWLSDGVLATPWWKAL